MEIKIKNNLSAINYQSSDQKAFTLIEVLISLAMIAILTGATLQVVRFSDTQKSLTIEADKLRAAVREVRSYSLSIPNVRSDPKHICGFGVYADSNYYQLFYTFTTDFSNPATSCLACTTYVSGGNCTKENIGASVNFPAGMTINSKQVFFRTPYGNVINSGNFIISRGTSSAIISISSYGKID